MVYLHALFFTAQEYVPDEFLQWLDNPQSWLGVHKIVYGALAHTPTSVFLLVAGTVISAVGGLAALWHEEYVKHQKWLDSPSGKEYDAYARRVAEKEKRDKESLDERMKRAREKHEQEMREKHEQE